MSEVRIVTFMSLGQDTCLKEVYEGDRLVTASTMDKHEIPLDVQRDLGQEVFAKNDPVIDQLIRYSPQEIAEIHGYVREEFLSPDGDLMELTSLSMLDHEVAKDKL